jgi:hypothetical protein
LKLSFVFLLIVLSVCAEKHASEITLATMRALADIATLKTLTVAVHHFKARVLLAGLFDTYHLDYPDTPISQLGKGIWGHPSKVAKAISAKAAQLKKQNDEAKAKAAAAAKCAEEKADADKLAALTKEVRIKAKADAKERQEEVVAKQLRAIDKLKKNWKENNAINRRRHEGFEKPSWKYLPWPSTEWSNRNTMNKWLSEKRRASISLVYDDIRELDTEQLRSHLSGIWGRLGPLFKSREDWTLCLLGSQSQTPTVATAMGLQGWQWGTPYVISIHSAAHTLSTDADEKRSMHKICWNAYKGGDMTFASQQGIIFRLYRGTASDSSVRGNGVMPPTWNAGRHDFNTHRSKTVPILPAAHIAEPYLHTCSTRE